MGSSVDSRRSFCTKSGGQTKGSRTVGYKISGYIQRFLNFIISFFLIVIFIIAAAYALFVLNDNHRVYSAAENVQEDMLKLKPDKERPDFSKLLSINPDVCAWLTMDGTHIDFPVLQGETNLTYINRDVYGEFALAGSIFLDSQNAKDFSDSYHLLYGHHMASGNMFGDLDLYKKKAFFKKNDTGTLLLPDRVYRLKVAAVLITGVSDDHIFQLRNWPKTWKEGQLDYIRSHALFAREDVLDDLEKCEHPQMVALTTCTSEFTDARTVVLAQMIPEKDADREE